MSIAGGLPRAVDRAYASRCDALQIFTKSAGQWRARELPRDEVIRFRRRVEETGIQPVVAHNSYLINVAAAAPTLRVQSIAALGEELGVADRVGERTEALRRGQLHRCLGALEHGLTDACRAGAQELVGMWGHPDQEEGPLAFAERREARWSVTGGEDT